MASKQTEIRFRCFQERNPKRWPIKSRYRPETDNPVGAREGTEAPKPCRRLQTPEVDKPDNKLEGLIMSYTAVGIFFRFLHVGCPGRLMLLLRFFVRFGVGTKVCLSFISLWGFWAAKILSSEFSCHTYSVCVAIWRVYFTSFYFLFILRVSFVHILATYLSVSLST